MVKKQLQPRTEDRTIHLHKLVYKIQFKKRAPRAISAIKQVATKCMVRFGVKFKRRTTFRYVGKLLE